MLYKDLEEQPVVYSQSQPLAQPLAQPPIQTSPSAQQSMQGVNPPVQLTTQPAVYQGVNPPAQPQESRPSTTYAMHLDRPTGKPDYLSIVDHLPGSAGSYKEAKVTGGVEGQPELFMRTGYQKKLSKVSPNEWNCANVMIMDKLIRKGALGDRGVREYLNYTFIINELASRYSWDSVLKYDDEYRQLQATQCFRWGEQVDHFSKVFLREKEPPHQPPPSNPRGGATSTSAASKPGKGVIQWCGLYNSEGKQCHYTPCKFAHVCAICGKDHPRYEHGRSQHKTGEPKEGFQ